MGARNTSAVRKEVRGGKPRWIVDFQFLGKDSKWHRYRRDASVQTSAAARAEADRLYTLATTTGSLDVGKEAPRSGRRAVLIVDVAVDMATIGHRD